MLAQIVRDRAPKKNHDSRFRPSFTTCPRRRLGAHGCERGGGPFAFIGPDVHIGAGTWVGPNATIIGNTKVGQDCKLFPGCVVGRILRT